MNTFAIIARLWYFAQLPRHPLIRSEIRRVPRWEQYSKPFRRIYRRLLFIALGLVVFGIIMELFGGARISFLMLVLTVFIPLLGVLLVGGAVIAAIVWTVPVSLAGSPVIVQEKQAGTWPLLLLTPLPRSDLLFAKLAVGLTRQQTFLTTVAFLQIFPLLIVLGQVNAQVRPQQGGLPLFFVVATAVLFVVDRLQELVLASLLGLTASLTADTWALATVGSVALGTITFLLRILVAYLLAVLTSGGRVLDAGPILVIGLPTIVSTSRNLFVGLAVLIGSLLVQELLIRFVLHWLLNKMSRP